MNKLNDKQNRVRLIDGEQDGSTFGGKVWGWRDWTKREKKEKLVDMDSSVVIAGRGRYKGTKI